MKCLTTNYTNTFIQIADDCPAVVAEIPPSKNDVKTAANIQFELISNNPYRFTSDDVLFQVFAEKNDLTENEYESAREKYFSKGQPCLRASPLTKRYGWGVHFDENSKIAIYAANSAEYQNFSNNQSVKVIKAMKSAK